MDKVLHLERRFTSKTETFIINQIKGLKKYTPMVFTMKYQNNFKTDTRILSLDDLISSRSSKYYISKREAKSVYDVLEKEKFSIIHTHYLTDAFYFRKLTKLYNIPKVCSCYGYDVSSFPNLYFGIPKIFIRKLFNEYDYFLAMSEDMKYDLMKIGCPEEKIIIHYYGTETKRFCNPSRVYGEENTVNILSVGTVEEKKAQHIVLESLKIVKSKYKLSNFTYNIVGGGNVQNIKKQISDLNLEENVFVHGYIDHLDDKLVDFYNSSHIFTHPSITAKDGDKEGIPGTIVEAMASGLPVISTYHAGIPYIIENEKEGLLVKERDVEGLANALYRLMTDTGLREKLGRNAQKRAVEELDLEKGTRELEEIYEKTISNYNKDEKEWHTDKKR